MLLYAVLSLIFVSCEDTRQIQVSPEGRGLVSLSMRPDIEVKTAEVTAEGVADYNFRFVGVDGYGTSEYYRFGDVENPMVWYFGIFRLQAESCTRAEAEVLRGRLRYEGIGSPFAVINGQIATASVICTVANVQVKVNFDDSMYEIFDDFKLTVSSVSAPPVDDESEESEEDQEAEEFIPETYRSLDFTTFEKSGYYNLQSEAINLSYTLYVKMAGATEFIPVKEGFFVDEAGATAVVNGGDVITFNVKYTGEVTITDGIKFIVSGVKTTVSNGLELNDYGDAISKEDN